MAAVITQIQWFEVTLRLEEEPCRWPVPFVQNLPDFKIRATVHRPLGTPPPGGAPLHYTAEYCAMRDEFLQYSEKCIEQALLAALAAATAPMIMELKDAVIEAMEQGKMR
jgi:hypothetical protein